ncbi:MAG: glutamine synthetase family protein [Chloroflexota bacterium]|nr:glutamine synthetase family protein [Chloroflexota bacterium]
MNGQDLLNRLKEDKIENLWVTYHDYNGRACAKTIPKSRFAEVVEGGVVFARANLNFGIDDHMAADGIWQAQTGDFLALPDPDAYWKLPYLDKTAIALCNMLTEEYQPFDGCPRQILRRTLSLFAERDMAITAALEAEFSLFAKTDDGDVTPCRAGGMFTLAGLNQFADFLQDIVATLEAMGIQVEQMGKEYGASQFEFSVRYDAPLAAADRYLISKEVTRALALQRGLIASYMPKPFTDLAGNGLHANLGLWDRRAGGNLLAGGGADNPLSEIGRQFVGGLLAHAPGLCGLGAPTVNSYKRLQPASWAPAHIAWGLGNRGVLLRVPDGNKRCRVEYRAGDNTCNPYFFLTALLAAGWDGLRKKADPGAPFNDEDVGHFSAAESGARGIRFLPRSLPAALDALEKDEILMSALAPVAGREFLKVKRLELETYNLTVHPWERQMYLEAP